jgi:hypothetical protein
MIARILFSLLVACAVCGLTTPVRAQLSEPAQTKFVAELHRSLGLSDMVERVRDGKVDSKQIRVIAAILRNTKEVHIHQMRGGANNNVYVSPDGHSEGVYDGNGKLVKDGINDGSYNYFDPQKDALRHFSFDITPWLLFGQSRDDPTTRAERIHAYSADVFDGTIRTLEAPRTKGELDDVNLEKLGCVEAVTIFLLAIELGNVEELIRVVNLQEKKSDEQLVQLIGSRFEAGLLKLISSDQDEWLVPE